MNKLGLTFGTTVPYPVPSWLTASAISRDLIPSTKIHLGNFPTPVHPLNLPGTEELGIQFFVKRDDVVVVGTIVRRWRPVVRGVRCTVDIALEANSVVAVNAAEQTVSLSDTTAAEFEQFWRTYREANAEFQARNAIVRSVCPQLYGMFPVKLALLLALIGGSSGAGSISSNSTIGPTSSGSVAPDATSSGAEATTVWGPGSEGGADRDGAATAADGSRGVHRRSQIHMLMVSSLRL
jgi:hypothetical protein